MSLLASEIGGMPQRLFLDAVYNAALLLLHLLFAGGEMCYDRTSSVAILEQQEREANRQQYACFETDQEGPTDTEEYGITLVSADL